MNYISTRNSRESIGAAQAITRGLAPDGGLYLPEHFVSITADELGQLRKMNYRERAALIMGKYLPEFSDTELQSVVNAAYGSNYDNADIAPVLYEGGDAAFLELFHGPTCAFKDMALQVLPHLLTLSLKKCGEERGVCILVATSGDTGKAALEGFADVPGTKILVFYPQDGVSDVQRMQMITQEGANVCVCAVKGNFDDAQNGVKAIFGDQALAKELDAHGWFLSSANSINWGRLLPQVVYYFSAYCDCVNKGFAVLGEKINFAVPTGNFGNILAGWIAKQMGLPVNKFICASNANNVLTDFINTGVYDRNRAFHTTISPSMDILISSNLERLLFMISRDDAEVSAYMHNLVEHGRYEVSAALHARIAEDFYAGFCDDVETKRELAAVWSESGYLMDTHTAVAHKVMREYRTATGDFSPCVIVSTASPYKFCESVLSALGEDAKVRGPALIGRLEALAGTNAPAPLGGLEAKPNRFTEWVQKDEMRDVVRSFLT